MTDKIKISELPVFAPAEYLLDEEDIAAYLNAILEDNAPALLAAALGDIAQRSRHDGNRQGFRLDARSAV